MRHWNARKRGARAGWAWFAGVASALVSAAMGPCLYADAHESIASSVPSVSAGTPHREPEALRTLLGEGPIFRGLDAEASAVRLQILVTEIPDEARDETWQTMGYRVGAEYLYPASAIKHLAAFALFARYPVLQPSDRVRIFSAPSPSLSDDALSRYQGRVVRDTTIDAIVRDALIVSGNDAYNRLVDILGHEGLNQWLRASGLTQTHLRHRLYAFVPDDVQRMAPHVEVSRGEALIVEEPARRSAWRFPTDRSANGSSTGTLVGQAYVEDTTGQRVDAPMDFADKNDAPIADLHRAMLGLAYPSAGDAAALVLSDSARAYLREIMATFPEGRPDRGFVEKADRYKPLWPGLRRVLPRERLEYVNKAGRAYGFHIESAWIRDRVTGRAMIITAGLYVNPDGVLNDDAYDYGRSYAFLAELGEWAGRRLTRPAAALPSTASPRVEGAP